MLQNVTNAQKSLNFSYEYHTKTKNNKRLKTQPRDIVRGFSYFQYNKTKATCPTFQKFLLYKKVLSVFQKTPFL